MSADELFAGFDPQRQAAYEQELTDRYGDDVRETIDESKRCTAGWQPRDYVAVQEAFSSVDLRTTQLIDAGTEPGDAPVQELIGEHFEIVARFWTPDAEQYARLGHLYVDHPEFRARYDAVHPGLAEFLRDAMAVYADSVLN